MNKSADTTNSFSHETYLIVCKFAVANLLNPAVAVKSPVVAINNRLSIYKQLKISRLLQNRVKGSYRDDPGTFRRFLEWYFILGF